MVHHQQPAAADGNEPRDLNNPKCANHKDSPLTNPKMSLKEMKEKIDFRPLSFFGSVFLGVVFCVLNRAGDVYLAVLFYCCSNVSLHCSTVPIVTCDNNEGEFSSYVWFYVIYICITAVYNSIKSYKTYKGSNKGENEFFYWKSFWDRKSWWTVARTALHFLLVALAAKYTIPIPIELSLLGLLN